MDHPVVAPADPSRLYWFTEAQWRQIEAVFPRPNGNKGFAQAVPNRQACEAVLFERTHGLSLARSADGLWALAHHLHALASLLSMPGCPSAPPRPSWRPGKGSATLTPPWLYWIPPWCAPTSMRRGREKKTGAAQAALGRSRGGLSTKIHRVVLDSADGAGDEPQRRSSP